MKNIVIIFFSTRLVLILSFFVLSLLIPYSGFFPYGEVAKGYHLPDILTKLTNFDGVHYLSIAKEGYHTYDQAYFPLYPLTIRVMSGLFGGNMLLAAVILSNISLLGVLWVVRSLLVPLINKNETWWFIFFLLCFPTAFFFSTIYTESFFLLFFLFSLYFFQSKKYFLTFLSAVFTSLIRLNGLFLILIFLTVILVEWYKKRRVYFSKEIVAQLLSSTGSVIGFSIYALYLFITTGDALFFFHAQPVFGANRSTNLILLPQVIYRYIKIFLTSDKNFQLFVSYLELAFFLLSFSLCVYFVYWILRKKRYLKQPLLLGLGIFSLITLILPTLTGTLSSIPRYCLLSLCMFLPLASINNKMIKIALGVLFASLQIFLFGLFVQGYFIS